MPRTYTDPLFCILCKENIVTRSLALKHFEEHHPEALESKKFYGCDRCKIIAYRSLFDLHQHKLSCRVEPTRAAAAGHSPVPLPEPLSEEEENVSSVSPTLKQGDYWWTVAKICSLEQCGVTDTTLEKFLRILQARQSFVLQSAGVEVQDEELPSSLAGIKMACDRKFCSLTVETHSHGAMVAAGRDDEEGLMAVRKRIRLGRRMPSSWSSISLYALVKKKYTEEWSAEILQQRRALAHPEQEYSTVMTGSVYKSSQFFAAHPEAAALALYVDGATIGDMRTRIYIIFTGTARANYIVSYIGFSKLSLYTFAVVVLNANPQRISREKDLHVVLTCDRRVLKEQGFDAIIAPLLQDLIQLRQEGVLTTLFSNSFSNNSDI